MVISFSVKEARDQLMNVGEVYTFRWKQRKQTGKTWANVKRNTKKIADVFIDESRLIETASDLDPYVSKSGFKTRQEWLDVIFSMPIPAESRYVFIGYLYKVTLRDVITYEITCGGCGSIQTRKNLPMTVKCNECLEGYVVDDYREIHSLNSQQLRTEKQ